MRANRGCFFFAISLIMLACVSLALSARAYQNARLGRPSSIPVTGAYDFGGCGGPLVAPIHSDFEQAVIEQTNAIRQQYGLPPLKRNIELANAARYHAADMSASNYFNHNTYRRIGGRLEPVCDTWQRIAVYYDNWAALAENIAAGQRTPESAIEGWMNSPEHRENILSASYSEIGVGFYAGNGEYYTYWGQNFGRRNGVYPLVIEGERARTNQREVNLYIYGEFVSMRLRNGSGPWTEWIDFQPEVRWLLPERPGLHEVIVQLNGYEGPYTTSDTIQLELPAAGAR